MLEPIENNEENEKNVKIDHEVLYSMVKSWLTPRPTGILVSPNSIESSANKNAEADQSHESNRHKFI